MKEYLVGFDSRVKPSESKLSQEIQDFFCLIAGCDKRLSVDFRIWQSIFDIDPSLSHPDKVGYVQGTWKDLSSLRDIASDSKMPIWIIAMSLFSTPSNRVTNALEAFPPNPNTINPDWEFLGYDIAEIDLLSGLMDMGYKPTVKPDLVKQYAPSLNENHLFKSLESAHRFCEWCDTRDKGHGPFYVYGLYLVDKIH